MKEGKTEGRVIVNDEVDLDQKLFGKIGGYVAQDDELYEFFTPREALTFSARLRLNLSKEE